MKSRGCSSERGVRQGRKQGDEGRTTQASVRTAEQVHWSWGKKSVKRSEKEDRAKYGKKREGGISHGHFARGIKRELGGGAQRVTRISTEDGKKKGLRGSMRKLQGRKTKGLISANEGGAETLTKAAKDDVEKLKT